MIENNFLQLLDLIFDKEKSNKFINSNELTIRRLIDYSENNEHLISGDKDIIEVLKLLKSIINNYFEPEINIELPLSSPEKVALYLAPYLKSLIGNEQREHFLLLLLDSDNKLISKKVMFIGTIDQCAVYPREILKEAILNNAQSIILVHNHPSGNPRPSFDDKQLTEKLKIVSNSLNLRVHDHIIATDNEIYSMSAECVIRTDNTSHSMFTNNIAS